MPPLSDHPCHYFTNMSRINCNMHTVYSEFVTDPLNLARRCKGASHYGLSADRKRRSQEGECTDSTSELTIAALPNDSPNSAVALLSDESGLVNPAFDPSMEDNSQSGSTTSLAARSNSKKSECECANGCLCLCVAVINPKWLHPKVT